MVLIGNSAKLNSELKESLTDLFLSFMKSYTFELIRLAPTNMKCSQLKCPRCTNCSAGGLATSRSSTSNKKISRSSGAHLQFTFTIKLWSNENRKLFCSSQTICFPLALHLSISVLDFGSSDICSAVSEYCWGTAGKLTSMTGQSNILQSAWIDIHR